MLPSLHKPCQLLRNGSPFRFDYFADYTQLQKYYYKIHVHLLVHTTCYIHHYLHEGLEVVVSIHLLHMVSQHFITEDVVILVREESGMLHG